MPLDDSDRSLCCPHGWGPGVEEDELCELGG